MKCKVINSSKLSLEKDVNDWLSSNNCTISQVLQTESDHNGYITLTIFYYELKELRKEKLNKLNLKK